MRGTWTKDKEIDDSGQGLISERYHKQTVSIKVKWHASIEDCVNAPIQGHEEYIKKSKERLITAANNSIDNIRTNKQKKNNNKIRKQKWE